VSTDAMIKKEGIRRGGGEIWGDRRSMYNPQTKNRAKQGRGSTLTVDALGEEDKKVWGGEGRSRSSRKACACSSCLGNAEEGGELETAPGGRPRNIRLHQLFGRRVRKKKIGLRCGPTRKRRPKGGELLTKQHATTQTKGDSNR